MEDAAVTAYTTMNCIATHAIKHLVVVQSLTYADISVLFHLKTHLNPK